MSGDFIQLPEILLAWAIARSVGIVVSIGRAAGGNRDTVLDGWARRSSWRSWWSWPSRPSHRSDGSFGRRREHQGHRRGRPVK